MTAVEPEVYSTPDTVVELNKPKAWKICPIIKEICIENNCKFWCLNECLIYNLVLKLLR